MFQKLVQQEKQKSRQAETAREKLLRECKILHIRLQECNHGFPTEDEEESIFNSSSLADALDLLTTSDEQISLLIAEVPFYSPFHLSPILVFLLIQNLFPELISNLNLSDRKEGCRLFEKE